MDGVLANSAVRAPFFCVYFTGKKWHHLICSGWGNL